MNYYTPLLLLLTVTVCTCAGMSDFICLPRFSKLENLMATSLTVMSGGREMYIRVTLDLGSLIHVFNEILKAVNC